MGAATITLDFSGTGYTAASVTMLTLVREDTGASVSFTASWTNAGGGVWTNTFTTPADGLTYLYTAQAVSTGGGVSPFSGVYIDAAQGYQGAYISSGEFKTKYGSRNAAAWTDFSGGTAMNEAAMAEAIREGEEELNGIFSGSLYAIPLVPTSGNTLNRNIKVWALALAAEALTYKRFGDEAGIGKVMRERAQEVRDTAASYAGGMRTLRNTQYKTGVSPAITLLEPTLNPLSENASLVPAGQSAFLGRRYQGQRFTFLP